MNLSQCVDLVRRFGERESLSGEPLRSVRVARPVSGEAQIGENAGTPSVVVVIRQSERDFEMALRST